MATQEKITSLIQKIDSILETPIEQLITSSEWGKINFEDIEEDIQKLYDMLNHLKLLPLNLLPETEIDKILNNLTQPKNYIEQIKKFDIEQADPKGSRNTISTNFRANIDAFYTATHLWIPYLAYQKGDVQQNINQLNRSVQQAADVVEKAKAQIEEKKQEIDSVVQAAKEASASVGVSHFSANFSQEATNLQKSAKYWLWTTIGLAVITLIATIVSYWWLKIPDQSNNAQIVQVLSTKLIIISIFFTSTLWAGKMYRAQMHQMTVNKHRANSLLTFQAFIKASNDNHTRDAVLMETTKSIFTLAPSGYIENDSSGSKQTNVVEIVKTGIDSVKKVDD